MSDMSQAQGPAGGDPLDLVGAGSEDDVRPGPPADLDEADDPDPEESGRTMEVSGSDPAPEGGGATLDPPGTDAPDPASGVDPLPGTEAGADLESGADPIPDLSGTT